MIDLVKVVYEPVYYKSVKSGKIFKDYSLEFLDHVFGDGTVDYAIENGFVCKIEKPSVIDCLVHGTKALATIRYSEIHGCKMMEAKEMVEKIKEDMDALKNKTPLPL